jgi:hypothetical protein
MTLRRSVAALSLATLLACCGTFAARHGLQPRASELFPLAPGSVWTYDVRDTAGRIVRLRTRVSGEVVLDGVRATLVEESGGVPGLESHRDLVAYATRGGLILRFPWPLPSAPPARFSTDGEPVLPADPRAHLVWKGHYAVLAVAGAPFYDVRSESRVTAADEAVAVRAGTFAHCVRIDTTVSARAPSRKESPAIVHYYTEWYAPGTGLVKAESAVDVDGKRLEVLRTELASFER